MKNEKEHSGKYWRKESFVISSSLLPTIEDQLEVATDSVIHKRLLSEQKKLKKALKEAESHYAY